MKRILFSFIMFGLIMAAAAQDRGMTIVPKTALGADVVIGRQYAFLIGIDKYKYWTSLSKPVSDTKGLKKILESDYYIDEFIELYDNQATRRNIAQKFIELQGKLGVNDSLLIYYSGHGHLDSLSGNGFWIPVDAGTDPIDQTNWLANSVIRGYIKNLKTIHVLLIADSCFAGDLLNPARGEQPLINNEYYRKAYKLTSREVLTAGSSETVPDNSEFAAALRRCLMKNNEPLLDPSSIYYDVRRAINKTTPLHGALAEAEHQNGAVFLLFRREKTSPSVPQPGTNSKEKTPGLNWGEETIETGSVLVSIAMPATIELLQGKTQIKKLTVLAGEHEFTKLTVGSYTVRLSYTGSTKVEERVAGVSANARATLTFDYRESGGLSISAVTAGMVEILKDGKSLGMKIINAGGRVPLNNLDLGVYTVCITYSDKKTETQTVSVRNGGTGNVAFTYQAEVVAPPVPLTPAAPPVNVPKGFVYVAGGTFHMGSTSGESDEKPVHSVTLTRGFYMSDHEVTQGEFADVMGKTLSQIVKENGWSSYGVGNSNPMYDVNWYQAIAYCNKLSIRDGRTPVYNVSGVTDWKNLAFNAIPTSSNSAWDAVTWNKSANGYRLPTEAEWEYAARGGSKSKGYTYSGSDTVGDVAWYSSNTGYNTEKVKTNKPNELGIYDLSGNVYEWCWDWYGAYTSGAQTDPTGAGAGSNRVDRGGSWFLVATHTRVANRFSSTPDGRGNLLGFRVVCF